MATTRIIVLFNLKPGVDHAAYEAWARSTDLPIVNALASVERFTVHAATALLGSDAPPPYQFVEIIDVADMALFGEETTSETMTRVAGEFQQWADPVFMLTDEIAA
jgi:hypothetical protein